MAIHAGAPRSGSRNPSATGPFDLIPGPAQVPVDPGLGAGFVHRGRSRKLRGPKSSPHLGECKSCGMVHPVFRLHFPERSAGLGDGFDVMSALKDPGSLFTVDNASKFAESQAKTMIEKNTCGFDDLPGWLKSLLKVFIGAILGWISIQTGIPLVALQLAISPLFACPEGREQLASNFYDCLVSMDGGAMDMFLGICPRVAKFTDGVSSAWCTISDAIDTGYGLPNIEQGSPEAKTRKERFLRLVAEAMAMNQEPEACLERAYGALLLCEASPTATKYVDGKPVTGDTYEMILADANSVRDEVIASEGILPMGSANLGRAHALLFAQSKAWKYRPGADIVQFVIEQCLKGMSAKAAMVTPQMPLVPQPERKVIVQESSSLMPLLLALLGATALSVAISRSRD